MGQLAKEGLRIVAIFASIFLAASSLPTAALADRVPVRILQVLDGDTVDVLADRTRRRVRLLGVDAPEVGHRGKPGEPYGRTALVFTRTALASAAAVELEVAGDRRDSYRRTLGFLWLRSVGRRDSVNLSEELLRKGLAKAVRRFDYPGKQRFLQLEAEARRNRRGLWRH